MLVSRGRIIGAVVALVVVALIVVGVFASAASRVPQVSAADVTKQDLTQTVSASGQIDSNAESSVFPPTTGTLATIDVTDGQAVHTGQTLAVMDAAPLRAAEEAAQAALAQARSGLVAARRAAPSSADRRAADAAVSAAAAAVSAARGHYDDAYAIHHLLVSIHASETSVTAAYRAKADAYSGLKQAQSGLAQAKAARKKLTDADAAVAAAAEGVDAADQALALAQRNVDGATLTAPIDGVVIFAGSSSAAAGAAAGAGGGAKPSAGSAVSPAAAPFSVVQLADLSFDAQVDEADVAHVAVGQKATVTLDAFPGVNFTTKVTQVKTQAISTSTGGTAFPVLLALKDTGKRLLVGMGGNVDIAVSGIAGAVVVPVEALFDEAGGTYVYVISGTVVHRTKVTTGITTDTQAQILSGVTPGQKVALGGLANLKDGMTVRVK